jgi:hypothetical protein
LDFISQGKTREEAKNNLLEVIQIQFEEMSQIGALDEYLAECGYEKQNNKIMGVPLDAPSTFFLKTLNGLKAVNIDTTDFLF